MTYKLRIEELDPEPDKIIFLDVARFENAVELKVSAPFDLCTLVLYIHTDSC